MQYEDVCKNNIFIRERLSGVLVALVTYYGQLTFLHLRIHTYVCRWVQNSRNTTRTL
jgi:hypothetical protein